MLIKQVTVTPCRLPPAVCPQAAFNESLAMDVADNETEGTSILYQAEDKGAPRGYSAPAWINK